MLRNFDVHFAVECFMFHEIGEVDFALKENFLLQSLLKKAREENDAKEERL